MNSKVSFKEQRGWWHNVYILRERDFQASEIACRNRDNYVRKQEEMGKGGDQMVKVNGELSEGQRY